MNDLIKCIFSVWTVFLRSQVVSPAPLFFCAQLFVSSLSSFNRDWRYHKEERVWITRAPGMEPTLKTNAYERGTYYFFDCLNWRKVAKVTHRVVLLWLLVVGSGFACRVDIVSASLRNFIWSMTSWRRGHTCQQHSTTTQPSRPSKARPVQRPQLFLHTTLLSRRGAVVHTAWFLFLEDLAIWLQGWSPPSKLPCLSKITCCPKTPTLVLFLFVKFLLFFLFWAGSVLCLRLWIWSLFSCRKEDWSCGAGQWQNKSSFSLFTSVENR